LKTCRRICAAHHASQFKNRKHKLWPDIDFNWLLLMKTIVEPLLEGLFTQIHVDLS